MDRNTATQTATAHDSYAALLAACQRGYVPTLRVGASDDQLTSRAKRILARELECDGCRVYG